MVVSGNSANRLHHLQPKRNSHVSGFLASCVLKNNDGVWHDRLCHASDKVISQIAKNCKIKFDKSFCFEACSVNKMHKLVFQRRQYYCNKPLQLLQMDIWGLALVTSELDIDFT